MNELKTVHRRPDSESEARSRAAELLSSAPLPPDELLDNLNLFSSRQALSRVLFLHELYRRIVPVHGVVMEFGVRWGQTLALFESFRGIYEPYNHTRRIIGFDTFSGFPSVAAEDGGAAIVTEGAYGVTEGYAGFLEAVLDYHEQESPLSHIRKFELVQGDVTETLPSYLESNPQTMVALAYFDLDLYEPTKLAIEALTPYLTKGSILGFDELLAGDFPGETVAVREALGLSSVRIERLPFMSQPSFIVVE